MLTIRNEQMAALARAVNRPFVLRLAANLREIFPAECARLGEAGVHRAIEEGIARAAAYGIDRARDVAEFVGLMFVIHPEFDTHPAFAWAGEVLRERTLSPEARLDRIDDLALERLGPRIDHPIP